MSATCCGNAMAPSISTPVLSLERCGRCGTAHATHSVQVKDSEPWHSVDVSPTFLHALRERREIQAAQIIQHFSRLLSEGPLLDYGCGQGIFLNALLRQGYRAQGCDLSREVTGDIPPAHFVRMDQPWSLPIGLNVQTVVLLDVLEHSPEPARFIAKLRQAHVRRLLVKVPVATGPLYLIARILAALGSPSILEKLYLVGDVAPHLWYFTARGLRRLMETQGYHLVSRLAVAEIGAEWPRRIRQMPPSWKPLSSLLTVVGRGMEKISPYWPETIVMAFELRV